ncbi:hypothetical protein L9F63_009402, partial [Diploptera punctata]
VLYVIKVQRSRQPRLPRCCQIAILTSASIKTRNLKIDDLEFLGLCLHTCPKWRKHDQPFTIRKNYIVVAVAWLQDYSFCFNINVSLMVWWKMLMNNFATSEYLLEFRLRLDSRRGFRETCIYNFKHFNIFYIRNYTIFEHLDSLRKITLFPHTKHPVGSQ